jgi:hypothetical protein
MRVFGKPSRGGMNRPGLYDQKWRLTFTPMVRGAAEVTE